MENSKGTKEFTLTDKDIFIKFMLECPAIGPKGWESIAEKYNTAQHDKKDEQPVERTPDSLRNLWLNLSLIRKSAGVTPKLFKNIKEVKQAIQKMTAMEEICDFSETEEEDDDEDDEENDTSSVEIVQDATPSFYIPPFDETKAPNSFRYMDDETDETDEDEREFFSGSMNNVQPLMKPKKKYKGSKRQKRN